MSENTHSSINISYYIYAALALAMNHPEAFKAIVAKAKAA